MSSLDATKVKRHVTQVVDNTQHQFRRQLTESSWNFWNWYRHINWLSTISCLIIPLVTLIYGYNNVPLQKKTLEFGIIYYIFTITCINAGYHRLWAHRSFTASKLIKYIYAIFGAGVGLGPIKWWVSVHRAHHRYVDTEKDPHFIRKGIFFSHFGWILLKPHLKVKNSVKECSGEDLKDDVILDWQEANYFELYLLTGLIFPSVVAGMLWNDYIGGLIYVGILRSIFVQHSTFLVNSVGHLIGTQCYDDRKSHKNNFILSFFSWGEGFNNFHHEFSADYRNGYSWYEFDPIKIHLYILSKLGLVKNLNRTPDTAVNQCLIQFQQKLIDKRRSKLNWGIPISELPIITPEEFTKLAKEEAPERALIAVSGIVHDVTPFMYNHPGGTTLIKTSIGKDATSAFNGAVYDHTTAAHNLLATMRVAVLSGGTEQIVWKQEQKENKDVPLKQSSGQKIVRTGEQATIIQKPIRTAGAA